MCVAITTSLYLFVYSFVHIIRFMPIGRMRRPLPLTFDRIQATSVGNFGRYQWRLLFVTQIGYMTITPSMLCTTLDTTVSQLDCITNDTSSSAFRSLFVEWNLNACDNIDSSSLITTVSSTSIMIGAVIGSFICGYFADRYGRKPIAFGMLMFRHSCPLKIRS